MPSINLPPIEDLDVDDLAALPKEYRYELHNGSLVVMTPSTYWHKVMSRRLKSIFKMRNLFLKTPSKRRLPARFVMLTWVGFTRLWGARTTQSGRAGAQSN